MKTVVDERHCSRCALPRLIRLLSDGGIGHSVGSTRDTSALRTDYLMLLKLLKRLDGRCKSDTIRPPPSGQEPCDATYSSVPSPHHHKALQGPTTHTFRLQRYYPLNTETPRETETRLRYVATHAAAHYEQPPQRAVAVQNLLTQHEQHFNKQRSDYRDTGNVFSKTLLQ